MSEIIKIALLGIAGVLFAIQFRQQRPEYTLLIGFALSVLVFSYVLGLTGQLLEEFAGRQGGAAPLPDHHGCCREHRGRDRIRQPASGHEQL